MPLPLASLDLTSDCTLLAKACKEDFDTAYVNQAACELDCTQLDGAGPNSKYTTRASGNDLQCRLLHVSRALTDATECAAAEGAASPCK